VSTDPNCQLCVEAKCCGQLLSCDHGTDCGNLLQCVVNCPMNDNTCDNACAQSFGGGVNALNDLSTCIGHCPQCSQKPPSSVCDSGLAANSAACDACLTIECCAEAEKCAGDGVCEKCLTVNAGPQCDPVYAPLAACMASRCPKACP